MFEKPLITVNPAFCDGLSAEAEDLLEWNFCDRVVVNDICNLKPVLVAVLALMKLDYNVSVFELASG
jgi:hypothetical protein